METEAKRLILQYGQPITITKSPADAPESTQAFIQPLRWDGQSALYGDYADTENTEQFLYIGPPNFPLSTYPSTTVITAENQNYIIKKAESVYLSGQRVYERAVLEKETEVG